LLFFFFLLPILFFCVCFFFCFFLFFGSPAVCPLGNPSPPPPFFFFIPNRKFCSSSVPPPMSGRGPLKAGPQSPVGDAPAQKSPAPLLFVFRPPRGSPDKVVGISTPSEFRPPSGPPARLTKPSNAPVAPGEIFGPPAPRPGQKTNSCLPAPVCGWGAGAPPGHALMSMRSGKKKISLQGRGPPVKDLSIEEKSKIPAP